MPITEDNSVTRSSVKASSALGQFLTTRPDDAPSSYWLLVGTLWDAGKVLPGALEAVPELSTALASAGADRRAFLAILLGLLASAENAGDELQEFRPYIDSYLHIIASAGEDPALTAALLYLLGNFTHERERILGAVASLALDLDDYSRLDRCLSTVDPDDTIQVLQLGRAFPAPSVWNLTAEDLIRHGGWAQWINVPAKYLSDGWKLDNRTLKAYAGGKALWLAQGRRLRPYSDGSGEASTPDPAPFDWPGLAMPDRHGPVLCCPDCHGPLVSEADAASCGACEARHLVLDYLDVIVDQPDIYDPLALARYGHGIREAWVRVVGTNWGAAVTAADEGQFLSDQVRPVTGPVLDIGPDDGRTTRVLVDKFGVDHVIALDRSGPMLRHLRGQWPSMLTIRALPYKMPIADGALGAVNCWNMWQGASEKPALLTEVNRCLRPGGTFTILGYQPAADPVNRFFQEQMNMKTMDLFSPDELIALLDEAGFTVKVLTSASNLMLISSVRRND